jgi:hypothetical protein
VFDSTAMLVYWSVRSNRIYVNGPVPWASQDTAILTVLLLLQPFVFGFFKIVRRYPLSG